VFSRGLWYVFGLDLSIDAMDVSGEQQVCVCVGGQSKAFFILYICFHMSVYLYSCLLTAHSPLVFTVGCGTEHR